MRVVSPGFWFFLLILHCTHSLGHHLCGCMWLRIITLIYKPVVFINYLWCQLVYLCWGEIIRTMISIKECGSKKRGCVDREFG